MTEAIWKTRDGQSIPVKWMISAHLVHSFNLVVRRNQLDARGIQSAMKRDKTGVLTAMVDELRARQLYNWRPDIQINTSELPARETPKQMCMLRALIDCGYGPNEIELFRTCPDVSIEHWTSTADPKWDRLKPKFFEYRLAYGNV